MGKQIKQDAGLHHNIQVPLFSMVSKQCAHCAHSTVEQHLHCWSHYAHSCDLFSGHTKNRAHMQTDACTHSACLIFFFYKPSYVMVQRSVRQERSGRQRLRRNSSYDAEINLMMFLQNPDYERMVRPRVVHDKLVLSAKITCQSNWCLINAYTVDISVQPETQFMHHFSLNKAPSQCLYS